MRLPTSIAMLLLRPLVLALFAAAPVLAESAVTIRGLDRIDAVPSTAALVRSGPVFQSIPEVSIATRAPGIGPIAARFRSRRVKSWSSKLRGPDGTLADDNSSPILLQGEARVGRRGEWRRAAASVIAGDLEVTFVAPSRRGGSKMVRIKVRAARDGRASARATSVPLGAGADKCGVKDSARPLAASAAAETREVGANAVFRRWDLATVVEETWIARFGSNANARVASIVNTVDTLYRDELGVTINIVAQLDGSGAYTSSNLSDTLLTDFADKGAIQGFGQPVTSAALYTNRPLDPDSNGNHGTNGIAFLGAVCNESFYYALLTARSPNIEQTTAHELGHNLNADHDATRYSDKGATIMFPSSVSDRQFTFSNFSIGQISSFLGTSDASCMPSVDESDDPDGDPTATPVPTTPPSNTVPDEDSILTLRKTQNGKNRFILSGGLFSNDGSSVFEGATVELYSNGAFVTSTVTDADGFYSFQVRARLRPGQRIVAQTIVTGTGIQSNRVKIKKKRKRASARRNARRGR